MGTLVRKAQPVVFTEVAVHADVEITVALDYQGADMAFIHIGHEAYTMLCCADAESLDLLAAVAADGARQLRERIEANKRPPTVNGDADPSAGTVA